MTDRIKVHALDPVDATDGQVPRYDAAAGRVVWADGSITGGVQSIVAGSGVTVDDTDPTNPVVSATGSTDPEIVRDTMAAALVAGTGVTIIPDDAGDTITISADGGGGGASVAVDDEGVELIAAAARLNFTGAGVTVTDAGAGEATVTIPGGGGGSLAVDDEGVEISAAPTRLNFVGSGVEVIDSGSGVIKVYISGFPDWSVDAPPVTPNAKDDEFDTESGLWTTTPTAPAAMDAGTTRPSHLTLKAVASSAALVGRYKAVPAAYPYTFTAKVTSHSATSGSSRTGIFIGPAAPTNSTGVQLLGWVNNSNAVQRVQQQLGGTWQGNGSTKSMPSQPLYLRAVVNSATSVSFYASVDGWAWSLVETLNPGFTPGAMGLFVNSEATASAPTSYFDWFRVS